MRQTQGARATIAHVLVNQCSAADFDNVGFGLECSTSLYIKITDSRITRTFRKSFKADSKSSALLNVLLPIWDLNDSRRFTTTF